MFLLQVTLKHLTLKPSTFTAWRYSSSAQQHMHEPNFCNVLHQARCVAYSGVRFSLRLWPLQVPPPPSLLLFPSIRFLPNDDNNNSNSNSLLQRRCDVTCDLDVARTFDEASKAMPGFCRSPYFLQSQNPKP